MVPALLGPPLHFSTRSLFARRTLLHLPGVALALLGWMIWTLTPIAGPPLTSFVPPRRLLGHNKTLPGFVLANLQIRQKPLPRNVPPIRRQEVSVSGLLLHVKICTSDKLQEVKLGLPVVSKQVIGVVNEKAAPLRRT